MIRKQALSLILAGCLATLHVAGQSLPPAQSARDAINHVVKSSSGANVSLSGSGLSTGSSSSTSTDSTSSTSSSSGSPGIDFNRGRLPFQLGITASGYFDDNIFVQPNGPLKISDYIYSLTPLIGWNSAAQTSADNAIQVAYAPSFVFYQDHPSEDTIDQSGTLIYSYQDGKSDFVFSEAAQSTQVNGPDFGALVKETISSTEEDYNYLLTGKTSVNFYAVQTVTDEDPGYDYNECTGAAYVDYQWTPKMSFGLGTLIGFADLVGPNQNFEQANVRCSLNPTAKLSFTAEGGLEFRETEGSDTVGLSPDISLGLSYQPFSGTNFNVNAYERYEYSARFFGQSFLASGISGSVQQRFFEKFFVTIATAYEHAQYHNNVTDTGAPESYNYGSISPSIAYMPIEWCELKAFYEYRRSLGEGSTTDFTDNQIGASARFTY